MCVALTEAELFGASDMVETHSDCQYRCLLYSIKWHTLVRAALVCCVCSAGGSNGKSIALVGKGLTFDSGGYNIKAGPGSMIEMMKFDMVSAVLNCAWLLNRHQAESKGKQCGLRSGLQLY